MTAAQPDAEPREPSAAGPPSRRLGRAGRGEPARARTSSSSALGAGQGRQRLGGAAMLRRSRAATASAPRSCSGGPGRCRGPSRTRHAARCSTAGTRTRSSAFTAARPRGAPGDGAGRASHLRIDPEIERGAGRDEGGAVDRRAARRRLAAGARAIQPVVDAGDRPRRRRGRAVGRPAQEVAPVREQGADRRRARSSTPDPSGWTSSTGSTARPRTGPGSSSAPSRPTATCGRRSRPAAAPGSLFAELPDGDARRDAVPRPGRHPGRGAVRRDDRGRRREPGQLPAQVGGDPRARASRARRATTCGASPTPGSTTSRPGSAAGRSGTSGPGTSCSTRSGGGRSRSRSGRGSGWSGCATGCGAAAARPGTAAGLRGRRGGATSDRRAPVRQLEGDGARPTGTREAVDATGGHVLQSRAWAEHRGRVRLAAAVPRRRRRCGRWCWCGLAAVVPGGSAYVPRGPVGPGTPWVARTGDGSGAGRRAARLGWRAARPSPRSWTGRASTCSPRTRRSPRTTRATAAALGCGRVPRDPGDPAVAPPDGAARCPPTATPAAVLAGVAKATRQRIRRAERDGVVVLRWDAARDGPRGQRSAPTEDARRRPATASTACCARPATGAGSGSPARASSWPGGAGPTPPATSSTSRRARARPDGDVLGGLVLYRHGRRLSTAHSGDRAERRRDHPGAMHLLRWRAIQLALAEGRTEMDLGGVDVAGARRIPRRGRADATACTSTSARSGRSGSRSPGPRSASRGAWRYAAGPGGCAGGARRGPRAEAPR